MTTQFLNIYLNPAYFIIKFAFDCDNFILGEHKRLFQ